MLHALEQHVVPTLRERGFRGSFPHFRRRHAATTDLLSFQFDKWGGGFVIELAVGPAGELVTPWGARIAAARLKAIDLSSGARARLQPGSDGSTDSWFRFDDGPTGDRPARFQAVAAQVLDLLPQAEAWWRGERTQRNVRPLQASSGMVDRPG